MAKTHFSDSEEFIGQLPEHIIHLCIFEEEVGKIKLRRDPNFMKTRRQFIKYPFQEGTGPGASAQTWSCMLPHHPQSLEGRGTLAM